MTIVYKYNSNLYINLTNRCSSACVFCLRQTRDRMDDSGSLWLEHEPDYEEVKQALSTVNMDEYDEVVFCGFGEPTEAFDVLIKVADYIKEKWNKPTRLNTNGQGNLINGRDITPDLEGRIDTVSISLNNPDPVKYQEIVRSIFGVESFDAMLKFAKSAGKYVKKVILSTVDTTISHEEEEQCRKICEDLGVTYRIREFED
ncbi:MAG: TatD family nuclease-associated radical SAM protein [Acetatifactor sp.]|nr:TatD family nuclease-associated radical SAM protein [Acetatifactor sp.]